MRWRRGKAAAGLTTGTSAILESRVLFALAGLLVLAQAPQALRLPFWLTCLGMGIVALRIAFIRRGRPAPGSLWLVPIVIAGGFAIRYEYGYFFGRDPGVALLFLMAGLKFMETRTQRDGTLVVCLSAFLALTQFLYAQSLLSAVFLVGTVFYIAFALHALSGTWRPAGNTVSRMDSFRPLLRLASTMLLQSVPLAIVLFLVFPRLTQPLWGMPTDASAKTGLSDQMEPGNISELTLSDDIAFHVEFPDQKQVPRNSLRYWRGPVLSQFDGRVWRAAPRANAGEIGRLRGPVIEYIVTLEPHQQRWLFALDLPAAMPTNDDGSPLAGTVLTREQQLLSASPIGARIIYRQSSVIADRHGGADELELGRLVRLPGNGNQRTRAFAREERAKHDSDAQYLQAMLRVINRENFGYTLEPPPVGINGVDDFLFETRRGFCEHYAGAFAFLMRAAGIPARVVTGYLGGEINPSSDEMIVRQSDAHAWVEAWIEGQWRRVDPTAAVAPQRIESGLSAALPAGARIPLLLRPEWQWLRELDWRWDAVNHGWQKWVVGFNRDRQLSLFSELGWPSPKPWQIAAIIGGAIAMWGFGYLLWSQWRQRARPSSPLEKLWQRINRRLARAGLPRSPSEGPLAYAERLCNAWPQHAALWRDCATSYALARYGEGDQAAGVASLLRTLGALRGLELSPRA